MKFLLIRRQGSWCDYTIECGTAVDEIEADDMEAAIVMLRKGALGDDDEWGLLSTYERELESAQLVPMHTMVSLPLDRWREEWTAKHQRAEAKREAATERALYERLKAKYE